MTKGDSEAMLGAAGFLHGECQVVIQSRDVYAGREYSRLSRFNGKRSYFVIYSLWMSFY